MDLCAKRDRAELKSEEMNSDVTWNEILRTFMHVFVHLVEKFLFLFFFSLSLSKDCHCNVVGKTGWRCFLVVDVEPGSNVKTLLSGVVVEVFSRTSGTDVVLQDKYALKVSFQSGQEVHRDTWCGGKHICKPGIAEPMIAVCFPFCCLYRGSHRLLYIWA